MHPLLEKYDYIKSNDYLLEELLPVDLFYIEEDYTIGREGDDYKTVQIKCVLNRKGTHLSRYVIETKHIPELRPYSFITNNLDDAMEIIKIIKTAYKLKDKE
jgi:hypothetical protein